MEKIGYIYLTTNLVNGKQYVGQHLSDGFDKYYKGSGNAIKNAFNKYGWDNFKCEIICWCSTQTQLNEAEDNYIKLLDTMYPNGYNLKGGGANGKHSKESIEKMILNRKGKNLGQISPMKGIKHTKEAKQKMSEAHLGKHLSEKTRQKMSLAQKTRVHTSVTKETKEKISKTLKGKPNKALAKRVYQYNEMLELIAVYNSLADIRRKFGYNVSHISAMCNNKNGHKLIYGSIWSYEPLH